MNKHLALLVAVACCAFVLDGLLAPGRTSATVPPATTYLYTGSEQTYAVPTNVTGINVIAVGAAGASCCNTWSGGAGGKLTADVPLPAGTSTLYVEVGGTGTAGFGGWNGGGDGPFGGGGATDLRTVPCADCAHGGDPSSLNSRIAVAGGGGGASESGPGGASGNYGGLPGSLSSPAFLLGGGPPANELDGPGLARTQDWVTSKCQGFLDQNGEPGNDGSLGRGGSAATFFITGPEDGGGGGGWYGGGGGGQCYDTGVVATANAGSGGGGSSGAPTSDTWTVYNIDTTDPAEVIITTPVPTATSKPTLAGGLTIGDVLSETNGQWASNGKTVTGYTYQWERCNASGGSCAGIDGATAKTYKLVLGDVGHTIRAEEWAENFYGSSASPSTSAATGVIGEPPISTAAPTISGTPVAGKVLVDSHGSWTDGPLTSYGYRWMRCAGGGCAAIAGAIDQSYELTTADVGSRIEVQETATNRYGTSAPATSAATSTVQAARLTLLGSLKASAKGVSVSAFCPSAVGTSCRGSAKLTTLERLLRGKVVALLARTKRHSKRTAVGSRSFTVAAGARTKIVVPLDRRGRKLLARFHRIPATLTITLLNTKPYIRLIGHTTIKRRRR